jgi:hypothetical protein
MSMTSDMGVGTGGLTLAAKPRRRRGRAQRARREFGAIITVGAALWWVLAAGAGLGYQPGRKWGLLDGRRQEGAEACGSTLRGC